MIHAAFLLLSVFQNVIQALIEDLLDMFVCQGIIHCLPFPPVLDQLGLL
jgi:hypothetical protein